jgi:ATP-binding cassette, subfamily G (WHITE), member 2, SNQ2
MAYTPGGDAVTLNDVQRSHISLPTADSLTPAAGVDVSRAEFDFFALSRQLSRRSGVARWDNPSAVTIQNPDDSYAPNGQSAKTPDGNLKELEKGAINDLEKGRSEEETERFDLREYLTSSNDDYQQAGIKHKVCTCAARATHWTYS